MTTPFYRLNVTCPEGHLITVKVARSAGLNRGEFFLPETCTTCTELKELKSRPTFRERRRMQRALRKDLRKL